jgi:pimeloyl-ACP methyl ester carboxylesterase
MQLFAADFISQIRALNRGPMHVVGHSTGGLIAALMLAQAPELFKKAVLLDPVGAQGITFDRSMIKAFEQMKIDRNLTGVVIGSTIHNNDSQSDFFNQVIVEDAFLAVKSVGHWVLEALDGLDVRAKLADVKHPVLVLHGEYDKLLPLADSQALAALFPNGKFAILPDQGHCANVENPEKFVDEVRRFLF